MFKKEIIRFRIYAKHSEHWQPELLFTLYVKPRLKIKKIKWKFRATENANVEEEVEKEHIFGITDLFIPTLIILLLLGIFHLTTQILPHRFTLVFQDFLPLLLPDSLRMLVIYIKHPQLREYVLKKLLWKWYLQPHIIVIEVIKLYSM